MSGTAFRLCAFLKARLNEALQVGNEENGPIEVGVEEAEGEEGCVAGVSTVLRAFVGRHGRIVACASEFERVSAFALSHVTGLTSGLKIPLSFQGGLGHPAPSCALSS